MKAWLAIAFQASVYRRALKIMLVVGVLLAIINHGEALFAGEMTVKSWVQVALTFLVPYCVSTIASVQAILHGSASGAADLTSKRG
jgi:hypothetical protein